MPSAMNFHSAGSMKSSRLASAQPKWGPQSVPSSSARASRLSAFLSVSALSASKVGIAPPSAWNGTLTKSSAPSGRSHRTGEQIGV
jgi:hypothetical protein